MTLRLNHILIAVLILCMAGIGLSTFLVLYHYEYIDPNVCGGILGDCDKVIRGPYSTFLGIPWAVIGLAVFVGMFALAYIRLYFPEKDSRDLIIPLTVMFSWVGLVSIIYLNYLELYVIHQFCVFCAATHLLWIISLILLNLWFFVFRKKVRTNMKKIHETSEDIS